MKDNYVKEVGERIRKVRKQRKISMKELGSRIGVSESAISRYENGSMSMPFNQIKLIADALNVSAEYLLDWKDTNIEKELFFDYWDKEIKNYTFSDSELKELKSFVQFIILKRGEK